MIITISDQHTTYLHDESRTSGQAESISFPENELETQALIRECRNRNLPVTVQGSRTGLCGGAVPLNGHVMNISRMAAPLNIEKDDSGGFLLTVQPGYLLASLNRDLRAKRFEWFDQALINSSSEKDFKEAAEYFWPPDPSELTASIGGIISTNGRGPGAYKYGSACEHVQAVRVITYVGEIIEAVNKPDDRLFSAIAGGEGMFGLITAVTLRLSPRPAEIWGICFFFDSEEGGAVFIDRAKALELPALAALDFLDGRSLLMVKELKTVAAKLRELPDTPDDAQSAVYIEIHAATGEEVESTAAELMAVAEELGSDMDSSWSLAGDEMEKLRLFRHAVPESINAYLDRIRLEFPEIHKMGCDLTLPGITFSESVKHYGDDLNDSGLDGVIFGHSSDNHLHVNLLPKNYDQAAQAENLLTGWLKLSLEQNGQLFREHGIGKVKKKFYAALVSAEEKEDFLQTKNEYDPSGFWNPGNKYERPE